MKGHRNHSFRAWAVFQCNPLRSSQCHPRALDGPWGWNLPLCSELPLNDPPFASLLMSYLEHLRSILKVPRLQTCSFRKQQWCCHCAQATTVSTVFWNIKISPLLSYYGSEGMVLCPGHCYLIFRGEYGCRMEELMVDLAMISEFFSTLWFYELWLPAGCVCVRNAFLLDGEEELSFHTLNLGEQSQDEKREKWWQSVSGGSSCCVAAVCHPDHCCWQGGDL